MNTVSGQWMACVGLWQCFWRPQDLPQLLAPILPLLPAPCSPAPPQLLLPNTLKMSSPSPTPLNTSGTQAPLTRGKVSRWRQPCRTSNRSTLPRPACTWPRWGTGQGGLWKPIFCPNPALNLSVPSWRVAPRHCSSGSSSSRQLLVAAAVRQWPPSRWRPAVVRTLPPHTPRFQQPSVLTCEESQTACRRRHCTAVTGWAPRRGTPISTGRRGLGWPIGVPLCMCRKGSRRTDRK